MHDLLCKFSVINNNDVDLKSCVLCNLIKIYHLLYFLPLTLISCLCVLDDNVSAVLPSSDHVYYHGHNSPTKKTYCYKCNLSFVFKRLIECYCISVSWFVKLKWSKARGTYSVFFYILGRIVLKFWSNVEIPPFLASRTHLRFVMNCHHLRISQAVFPYLII